MRRSLVGRVGYGLSATLIALLVLLAVSMSLLRVAVAYAPQLRGEVERVLAQALERPLTIGGMRAEWSGRHPRLILEDVRLRGDGPLSGLHVPELEVDVDLLGSLRGVRPRLAQVAVSGLNVHLHYTAEGSLRVARVGNADMLTDLFSSDGSHELPARVQLRDATVTLDDLATGVSYRLPRVAAELEGDGRNYMLAGYLPLPDALGRSVRFRAEWRAAGNSHDIAGRVYLDASRLRLQAASALLTRVLPLPAARGSADAELWLDLDGGRIAQITGELAAHDVELADASNWRTVAGQLETRFVWQREASGWQLTADQLSYASAYRVWPKNRLTVRLDRREQRESLKLRADYLHLHDLATAAALLPAVPADIRQRLAAARPDGEMLAPNLAVTWSAGALVGFDLHTQFRMLAMQPVEQLPGVRGLSGELWAREDGGRVRLAGQRGEVHFASLFRDPLPFHSLQGEMFWQIGNSGWQLEVPQLTVANADGAATARLRVVDDQQSSPFFDLRARLRESDASSVSRYLPAAIMPDEVVHWLDGAIAGGQVQQADLVLFGRANDFPFDKGTGVFDVRANVADVTLRYQDGWPAIEQASGQVRFVGSRMDIDIDRATTMGASILGARAVVSDVRDQPLVVDGKARGTGAQLLQFLTQSPLTENVRAQLAGIQLDGTHDVELRTVIPLHDGADARVQGELALKDATYRMPALGLAIEKIHGTIRFDHRGVHAERIRGRFRGAPVVVSARTSRRAGADQIRIFGRLRAAPEALLGGQALPRLAGRSDWDVQLALPGFQASQAKSGASLELQLRSSLHGLAIDLPAPLGKSAAQERPLSVTTRLGAAGLEPVRISYGDSVRAAIGFADNGFEPTRAAITFGGEEPALPLQGVVVRGHVEELNVDEWQAVAAGGEATAELPRLALNHLDLHVAQLRVRGQRFAETTIQIEPTLLGWGVLLEGPDVAGDLELAEGKSGLITARLARLRVQRPTSDATYDDTAEQELPVLDIVIDELLLGEQSLGRLEFVTRATATGTVIERAQLDGPLLKLAASGGWQHDPSRSQLAVTASGADVGRVFDVFGHPRTMRGGALQGSMNLGWDGGPTDFDLARVSGSVDITVSGGQILAVEPGAGRLFGLLSVTELPRRLSLDFSDLFGKGFSFDRIEARFDLADGDAYTRQFYMKGPSARVDLDGRIGLLAQDYDQRVTVTPNVSNTLPAIGGVAGGPVGLVAGLVTQRLLQKEINKLSSFSYRVAGSWDAPQIDPVGAAAPETAVRTEPVPEGSLPQ